MSTRPEMSGARTSKTLHVPALTVRRAEVRFVSVLERIDQARERFRKSEGRRHEDLYRDLSDAYGAGLELRHNEEAWASFVALPLWQEHRGRKPRPNQRDKALFFATMAIFGGVDRDGNKRASDHFAVLLLLDHQGMEASRVVEVLRERNYDVLMREGRQLRKVLNGRTPPKDRAPRLRDLRVKVYAELGERLKGTRLFLVSAEDGSVVISADPDKPVPFCVV